MNQILETINLKIKKEYEDLVPRLEADDYHSLKESIKKDGIRVKLHVLPDGTILCGHTRYKIAQELNITSIPYEIVNLKNEQDIQMYIIEDNLIRRHLSTAQKINLGFALEKIEKERAKERQDRSEYKDKTGQFASSGKSALTGQSRDKVGDKIGVSGKTFEKGKKIKEENPDLWDNCLSGRMSVDKAYKQLTEERKIPTMPFRQVHIPMIVNGTKTQTSRGRCLWEEGDTVEVVLYEPNQATVKIKQILQKKLKDFTEEDAKREGGYTLKEFKKVWKSIHGDWNENQTVSCIIFQKV